MYGYNFIDNGVVSKIDLWTDGIQILDSDKTKTANNLISSFNYFFRNSDSKQQESLGKGKDFVYSENSCYKKLSCESLADKNELSDKSDKSINDASLGPLSEIKNLRLRNVNKVIIGNININSPPNKF